MSEYYFPKGKMVIKKDSRTAYIVWYKNNRGRGRWIAAGQGIVNDWEFAEEIYRSFTERGQLG